MSEEEESPSHNTRLSRQPLRQNQKSDKTDRSKSPKKGRKLYPELKSKSPKTGKKLYPALANLQVEGEDDEDPDGVQYNFDIDDVYDNDSSNITNESDLDNLSDDRVDVTDGGKCAHVKHRGESATPKVGKRGKKARQHFEEGDRRSEENVVTGWGLGDLGTIVVVCAFILIAVGGYIMMNKQTEVRVDTEVPAMDYFHLFKPNYETLKQKFPSQSTRFWKIIGTPLKRVLSDPSPTYPAVIMLGVADGQSALGTCISRHIAQQVNHVFEIQADSYINVNNLDQSSTSNAKLELDKKLASLLTNGKVVVLDHLEQLHPVSALLLHAYCDGDNAPFKNATVILVVHTDRQFADTTEKSIEQFLTDIWQPRLGVDETPALRSRVANNIAVVTPETEAVKHC